MRNIINFKEKADIRLCFYAALYITALLANLAFGYRYISFGAFNQSGGIIIFPFSFIISDILTEKYGSFVAKRLLYYGILCQFIFALYAAFIIRMPAPGFLIHKEVYSLVFDPYLQFSIASSISIWIGSVVNIVFLSKLSEYYGGKYFALRSFIASTTGEFLVTFISMIIANFSRMELNDLFYMIFCCFILKTIISFFAIWPAAIVVYNMDEGGEYDVSLKWKNLKNPIKYIKNIALASWYAKGYVYNLELINTETKKAEMYYKGSRKLVSIPLNRLFFCEEIISRCPSIDAAHIGYYSACTGSLNYTGKSLFEGNVQKLADGVLNIRSINRNKKITIYDSKNEMVFSKNPCDIYFNKKLIERFSSTQALYIGYLTGIYERSSENNNEKYKQKRHLVLVK